MLDITFKYKDWLSKGDWRTQHCTVNSINECIRIYGLNDPDVEYEFIEVIYPNECECNNRFMTENKIENCMECANFNWCKEIHK